MMQCKLTESQRRLIKSDYNFDRMMMAAFEEVYSKLHSQLSLQQLLMKYRKLAYQPAALHKFCRSFSQNEKLSDRRQSKPFSSRHIQKTEVSIEKHCETRNQSIQQLEIDKYPSTDISFTTKDTLNSSAVYFSEPIQTRNPGEWQLAGKIVSDVPMRISYLLLPDGTIDEFSICAVVDD